ncbi:MAG: potassium-transporting ATPase subunit A [Chroococcidiopsidaceae cyanobacterium CP_BM_ER_R8_30]|nr:potassium-transporting ATPase subunit A [Chroococcidiopsidaceae cyanobacterium CP_BM_ER_R8_30]
MLQGFFQIAVTLIILVVIAPFFGRYMARVYLGEKTLLDPAMIPLERVIYILSGVRAKVNMTGWQYIRAVMFINIIAGGLVFALLKTQTFLPLNPTRLATPAWDTVFHTTISFLTNTDQQHYSGETTLSYLSQILGIGYMFFVSAATGLAVGIAFIRGLTGKPLGNFYVDLTLSVTRILLPISLVGAILLLASGVPETLLGPQIVTTLDGATQPIARGPVAHFEIIKQLGENGGGFFGQNSAHPFENPNPATNLLETIAMASIPAAFIFTYGVFIGNTKQAKLLFWMVFIIFVVLIGVSAVDEYQGNPLVNDLLDLDPDLQANLEGKETRFGWAQTALFTVTTTGTMCGAVNAMLDSLMPLGQLSALFNLFLQIIWGGQGTGTAYLFIYLILSVFVTGLMVGRTPEFLGRKIEKPEVVLASVVLLVHPLVILFPMAITLAFPDQLAGTGNPGFHGVTEVVYEYASAAANNGSGFAGLGNSEPAKTALWWNLSCLLPLILGRYLPIVAMLLLANNMAHKQPVPETVGTLRTDTVLFTIVTAGVIVILGVLTFFPVMALGPIAEAFQIARG